MFRLINSLKNRKGFTLIELIVVLAVLAIIMAIAVPRFMGIQDQSRIKADASTAQQIISSARLQEANNNGTKVAAMAAGDTKPSNWDDIIMTYPVPQSGGKFTLTGGGDVTYKVNWTPTKGSLKIAQEVEESKEFVIDVTP